MPQTKVRSRNTIRTGSAKVEIGERLDKLIDIGACRSISVKETMTVTDIESDNAGIISTVMGDHKLEVTLDSLEINFEKIAIIRGGVDKFVKYDGKTEITRKYNVLNTTYTIDELITIPYLNADGSDIIISSVELENESGITALTSTADYEAISTNKIKVTSRDINPSTDSIIITFKHTPKQMKRLTTGGGDAKIKPQWLVITNTNAKGEAFKIICPQASVTGGLELPFSSDKATDVMVNKFAFTANASVTEENYEQLAWFEDEQDVDAKEETPPVRSFNNETPKIVKNESNQK